VFAGDRVVRRVHAHGLDGTFEIVMKVLDLIISLHAQVVVPGHDRCAGIEGRQGMKAYLEYVRAESKRCFRSRADFVRGVQGRLISDRIEVRDPARLYMNVERAYGSSATRPRTPPGNT